MTRIRSNWAKAEEGARAAATRRPGQRLRGLWSRATCRISSAGIDFVIFLEARGGIAWLGVAWSPNF
jgi:hypothetical protein